MFIASVYVKNFAKAWQIHKKGFKNKFCLISKHVYKICLYVFIWNELLTTACPWTFLTSWKIHLHSKDLPRIMWFLSSIHYAIFFNQISSSLLTNSAIYVSKKQSCLKPCFCKVRGIESEFNNNKFLDKNSDCHYEIAQKSFTTTRFSALFCKISVIIPNFLIYT